jgi:hypothetical protein
MVCTSGPPRNRCAGGHALPHAYRDCYVGSLAQLDGHSFPNQHAHGHTRADRNSDADSDHDSFSHADTHIDSHAASDATPTVADPRGDVSSTLLRRRQRALDRRRCDPPDTHGL